MLKIIPRGILLQLQELEDASKNKYNVVSMISLSQ